MNAKIGEGACQGVAWRAQRTIGRRSQPEVVYPSAAALSPHFAGTYTPAASFASAPRAMCVRLSIRVCEHDDSVWWQQTSCFECDITRATNGKKEEENRKWMEFLTNGSLARAYFASKVPYGVH